MRSRSGWSVVVDDRPRVVLDPRAEKDVEAAVDWYDQHASGVGDRFIESLDSVLDTIAEYPEMYPKTEGNIRRALLKRFPYVVYYSFVGHVIRVIAILHTSRRPDYWKDR